MFISTHCHRCEVARLTADLKDREEQIVAFERRAIEAERSRHQFLEEVRYVIEAGGEHVRDHDALRGKHLRTLGRVLPYLLSGKRHWNDPEMPEIADLEVLSAKKLASEYGFALPDDPESAVKAMLDLALVLFNPTLSYPLEKLRNRHPLP